MAGRARTDVALLIIALLAAPFALASPVEETVREVRERLRMTLSEEQLIQLNEATVLAELAPEERARLGREFIRFEVDRPVTVFVLRSVHEKGDIFWLRDRGFEASDLEARAGLRAHRVWRRDFAVGEVGLGINTFRPQADPCFFIVRARDGRSKPGVTVTAPDYLGVTEATVGAQAYVDDLLQIEALPPELEGGVLIQPKRWVRDHAQVVGWFQRTGFPSGPEPDQVTLTWSDDPRTTQTIQWRTGSETSRGAVAYLKRTDFHRFSSREPIIVEAESRRSEDDRIVNDGINHRHQADLTGLEPDTDYVYAVGDGTPEGWSGIYSFRTAPSTPRPFSFIYMGDVEQDYDRWHSLLMRSRRERPDAAFVLMAGDMVTWGVNRANWDEFFHYGSPVFGERPLVPVLGNHEAFGLDRHPTLFLDFLGLPDNGPAALEAERSYWFEYGDALFIALDCMQAAADQARWMDDVLTKSDAKWKIVSTHFALYSVRADRDYKEIREAWVPVFDKHGVDFVLQGHDHVYSRSAPLRGHRPVAKGEAGTYYVIAVASTEYSQVEAPFIGVAFEGVETFQVFDFQGAGRLSYQAIDIDGKVRDEVIIQK